MPAPKLNPNEIEVAMKQLDHWLLEPQNFSIFKEWHFNNFKTVVNLLNRIFTLADEQNHHPEILTTYTNLRIRLWTHDAEGLTQKDFTLAYAIDQLIASDFDESITNRG